MYNSVVTRPAGSSAKIALAIVLAGLLANLLFNMAAASTGVGYPWSTFLFLPTDRFADFFKLAFSYPGHPVHPAAHHWGVDQLIAHHESDVERFRGSPINHFHVPPIPTLLALAARWLMQWVDPVLLLLVFLATTLTALFKTVLRLSPPGAAGAALASAALLGYPTLFAIDRGHFFSIICAIVTIGATLRTLRDGRSDGWSILMFAIALNIRPNVGIVPLALFVGMGKLRVRAGIQLGVVTVTLFVATFALVHSIYPAYTLQSFRAGLRDYTQLYVFGTIGYPYGSSLFGMLRVLSRFNGWTLLIPPCVAGLIFALALIYTRIGLFRKSEYLFATLCAYALGSQIFADYHLLVFIIPLVLVAEEGGQLDLSRWAILLASSLILSPKNYLFLPNGEQPVSWQVVANPLILLTALTVLFVAAPLRRRQIEDERTLSALAG